MKDRVNVQLCSRCHPDLEEYGKPSKGICKCYTGRYPGRTFLLDISKGASIKRQQSRRKNRLRNARTIIDSLSVNELWEVLDESRHRDTFDN